jgi:FtsH-binding integral membrane protein
MSYEQQKNQAAAYGTDTVIDAGLQAHMRSVYNTMGLGLAVTALVAMVVANVEPLRALVFGPMYILFALAPLGFLFFGFTPGKMARWPASKIRTMFFVFAGVMGLSMAAIFAVFPAVSIARVFFVTAATFAAASLYGYTAKKDLTAMGSFLIMGMIGIFVAALVNMFFQSSMMQFIISAIGVVVFTGLTAWETQRLKESYAYGRDIAEANAKMAIMGALSLYLNFINLFQSLMHLMGNRE